MSRAQAADDFDAIRARLGELGAEKRKQIEATTTGAEIERLEAPQEQRRAAIADGEPEGGAPTGLAPQHVPEDDWQSLKQASCQTAEFLRFHLGRAMQPIGARSETLRDRLAELGLIAGPKPR